MTRASLGVAIVMPEGPLYFWTWSNSSICMTFKKFSPHFEIEFGDSKVQFQENFMENALTTLGSGVEALFQVNFVMYLLFLSFFEVNFGATLCVDS